MAAVHCLGVLVVDALSGPITQYPVPRVTPQINTKSVQFLAGGGAANTSSALAQLGVSVAVFSKVGVDANGMFLRSELSRNGVDIAYVSESKSESTPFTFVGIHAGGERSFIHTPGCNLSFSIADVDLRQLYRCEFLLYQDMWVLPKMDGPSAVEILRGAQKRGITTLLDECYGLGPQRHAFEAALPYCDIVLPSYDDMLLVYPGLSPSQMASRLRNLGAKTLVLKLGQHGCLVSTGDGETMLPSVADRIVDTTGAGDCFDAGFIAGLIHGMDMIGAAKAGGLAAAACIRNVGGAVGIPKFSQLIARETDGPSG